VRRTVSPSARRQIGWAVLFGGVALAFQVPPAQNVLLGLYAWHIRQPETVHGVLEAVGLFAALAATVWLGRGRRWTAPAVAVLAALYLRLHQVLAPALLALLYFEIVLSIGRLVRAQRDEDAADGADAYLDDFAAGLAVWAACALILSVLGWGRFAHLRWMTVVLGLVSLCRGMRRPLAVRVLQRVAGWPARNAVPAVFLMLLMLIQFAKSNRAIDYDSIWYGLRPEYVLVGDHSFFDDLGLLQFVHYYPKLMELFFLPISNLGDYSFLYAGNALLLGLLLLLIFRFSRTLGARRTEALLLTCVIGSLPVVSNMASTAKSDLFSAFFLTLGAYGLLRCARSRDAAHAVIGLTALALALGGKLTSYLFVPLLLAGTAAAAVLARIARGRRAEPVRPFRVPRRQHLLVLLLAGAVLLGITFRTYRLTGCPLYPDRGRWAQRLGFTVREPLRAAYPPRRTVEREDALAVATHWYRLLFNPRTYLHYYVINWPGNVTLYLFLTSTAAWVLSRRKVRQTLLLQLACLPLLIGWFRYATRIRQGGDGNYYLVPVILGSLCFSFALTHARQRIRIAAYGSLLLFLPLQSALMFVSHWSWSHGTDRFSLSLCRPVIESPARNREEFRQEGLLELEDYIRRSGMRSARAMGTGPAQVCHKLSCRYEDMLSSLVYGNPAVFESDASLRDYLGRARMDYLILRRDRRIPIASVRRLVEDLAQDPRVTRVEAAKHYLLDVRPMFGSGRPGGPPEP